MQDSTPAGVNEDERRRRVESLAREILALRAKGDATGLAQRLAPDFVYRTRGGWPMWPFYGGPMTRAQFADALARINAEYDVLRSDFHEFLIDGEQAAFHVTFATRNRGSGSSVEYDHWICFRFDDGLLAEAAVYIDVAKAAGLQPGGLFEIRRGDRGPKRGDPRALAPASGVTIRPDGTVDMGEAGNKAPAQPSGAGRSNPAARVVLDFLALRAKGDVEGMLSRMAPDFVYNPRGGWARLPLQPDRCDRAAFARSLRLLNIEIEDRGGPVHELVVDGDSVAIHRTSDLRNRGGGGSALVDEWAYFRIENDLIVEMASYVDNGRAAGVEWPSYGPAR